MNKLKILKYYVIGKITDLLLMITTVLKPKNMEEK